MRRMDLNYKISLVLYLLLVLSTLRCAPGLRIYATENRYYKQYIVCHIIIVHILEIQVFIIVCFFLIFFFKYTGILRVQLNT